MTAAKPRLVLDCDGVLYNLTAYCLPIVNARLGTTFTEADITDFDWTACLGADARRTFVDLLHTTEVWHAGEPYPGVVEGCQELARWFDLYVVTNMTEERFARYRRQWLEAQGIPITRVIVAADKAEVATKIGARVAVEDNADNANALARAGVTTFLIAYPYNDLPLEPKVRRGTWAATVHDLVKVGEALATATEALPVAFRTR